MCCSRCDRFLRTVSQQCELALDAVFEFAKMRQGGLQEFLVYG